MYNKQGCPAGSKCGGNGSADGEFVVCEYTRLRPLTWPGGGIDCRLLSVIIGEIVCVEVLSVCTVKSVVGQRKSKLYLNEVRCLTAVAVRYH